ncbi:hypothetical protein C9I92_21795 [Photobacterium ganghwense]|uniref:Uncharacterized protein n=1 Tax=Photobacterium ganghwense TaxID=320778 RepID=A0A0J1HEX4_9GAMM|nr:hypothetical protein [Photobacterium ganghwense]KLV10173.1 hypothetical protein ABT57_06240 [Photobacterium ganghwense]PSU05422.1 hypothetical protein C9I92_21795 [Photobacterium ganghwense]
MIGALLGFLKSNVLVLLIKRFFKALFIGIAERLINKDFALEAFLTLLEELAERTQSKRDDRLVARMRQITELHPRKEEQQAVKANG